MLMLNAGSSSAGLLPTRDAREDSTSAHAAYEKVGMCANTSKKSRPKSLGLGLNWARRHYNSQENADGSKAEHEY
jgi:hypothetical protein